MEIERLSSLTLASLSLGWPVLRPDITLNQRGNDNMYNRDQAKISEFARANSDNFGKVLSFVVLTIRNRLFNLPADMETLQNPPNQEELAGVLYGFKMASIEYIEINKESLFQQAELINYFAETTRDKERQLLELFAQIFGIGLVKSGFICQLIYGVSGCIDMHNIAIHQVNPNSINSNRYKNAKRLKTRRAKLDFYCDLVSKCGGTEALWNNWCIYLSKREDKTGEKMNRNVSPYKSANHVSALHCISLGID